MLYFFLALFFLLSVLSRVGASYMQGPFVCLAFLNLGAWGIVAGNLLLLLVLLCRRRFRWWGMLPLAGLLLQGEFLGAMIQPFGGSRELTVEAGSLPLTVVTYNTSHFTFGKQYYLREAMAAIAKDRPDIICFQEAPDEADYRTDTLQAAYAAYPYQYRTVRTDHSRIQLLSRYPLQHIEPLYFEHSWNAAVFAEVVLPGQILQLVTVHLETTSVNDYRGKIQERSKPWSFRLGAARQLFHRMKGNFGKRREQVEVLRQRIQSSPYPVLLCGDFNDPPSSYTYHTFHRILTDGFREAGSGYQYTFRGLLRLLRIDYVFYSKELEGWSCLSPEAPYSDHNRVVWKGKLKI